MIKRYSLFVTLQLLKIALIKTVKYYSMPRILLFVLQKCGKIKSDLLTDIIRLKGIFREISTIGK